MNRIEAAHAAHTAVGWLLHTAAPWIVGGLIFGITAAATWHACDRLYAAHRLIENHRRQHRAERAVLAETRRTINDAAQQINDETRKEKP